MYPLLFLLLPLVSAFEQKAGDEEEYVLTSEDFANALALDLEERLDPDLSRQGYFDGDITNDNLNPRKAEEGVNGLQRSSVRHTSEVWADGIIPYKIEGAYTQKQKAHIAAAFKEIEGKTCIRFVGATNETPDYVVVSKSRPECSSWVGRKGGRQLLHLTDGCFDHRTLLHEFLHVLGFYHEHTRYDRDEYVTIHEENIEEAAKEQFKLIEKTISRLWTMYDYASVLHYNSTAFSKNNKRTIVPKDEKKMIGVLMKLSVYDAAKINSLYCNGVNRALMRTDDLMQKVSDIERDVLSNKKKLRSSKKDIERRLDELGTKLEELRLLIQGVEEIAKNNRGPKGDKGDKGDRGEKGAQGPKGDRGPPGKDGKESLCEIVCVNKVLRQLIKTCKC